MAPQEAALFGDGGSSQLNHTRRSRIGVVVSSRGAVRVPAEGKCRFDLRQCESGPWLEPRQSLRSFKPKFNNNKSATA
ncbi:hypothetical protein HUJ05_004385 [Dendroctonus ponderosae]|nr:hypothetical protein HUJ05_004385 [Dendroctonus ponderosae]